MKLPDHQRQKILELLTKQLEEHADSSTKQWFENYLKGAIEYRGLKTPLVSSLVKKWYQANQLQSYTLQLPVITLKINLQEQSISKNFC
jgi:hypothetical protein